MRAALQALAGGRLNVEAVGYDEELFAKAAAASNQSTALFAVISALVGFLFAFNAMLLTVPQRRRLVARPAPRRIHAANSDRACCCSTRSRWDWSHACSGWPSARSSRFTCSTPIPRSSRSRSPSAPQRAVSWQSIAIAVGGGMLAAIVAVLSPLRDDALPAIRSAATRRARASFDAARRRGSRSPALACLVAAHGDPAGRPRAAIPGWCCWSPRCCWCCRSRSARRWRSSGDSPASITSAVPHLARDGAERRPRACLAIAATGAIAVFGSVAVRGAHDDLLAGLEGAARETNALADVWVSPAGSYNLLKTTPFAPTRAGRAARLPGVRAVGLYRGGLLDYGQRRVLVSRRRADARPLLPRGSAAAGRPAPDERAPARGGWLVLSRAIAEEHHLHVGQLIHAAEPESDRRFRLAALSTNLGWAPGAIIMNASDYARAWGSADASAYSDPARPRCLARQGVREIERALGPGSGLACRPPRSTRRSRSRSAAKRSRA